MNQHFLHTSNWVPQFGKTRRALVGLVTVGALIFGTAGTAWALTPKTITLGAAQSGSLVTVNPGTHIIVQLNNDWTFSTQGSKVVVKLLTWRTVSSPTSSSGANPGSMHAYPGLTQACVPGNTCTATFAQFYALRTGQTRLIGRLTLTGCPPTAMCASPAFWTVVIRVR